MSTLTEPESVRQAQRHESVTNSYRLAGLCVRCAAQAAYGHQHGFSTVRRPCTACRSVVERFPVGKPNGWRALPSETGFASRPGGGPTGATPNRSHGNQTPHPVAMMAGSEVLA